jgi:predicted site-specific integrase-resolvase
MDSVLLMPDHEVKDLVESLKVAVTELQGKMKGSEKDFVSNEEFMQMMSISKRTAQNWRDEGVIAFSQVGSKIYYRLADINELLQETRKGKFTEQCKKKGGKS